MMNHLQHVQAGDEVLYNQAYRFESEDQILTVTRVTKMYIHTDDGSTWIKRNGYRKGSSHDLWGRASIRVLRSDDRERIHQNQNIRKITNWNDKVKVNHDKIRKLSDEQVQEVWGLYQKLYALIGRS